MTIKSVTVVGGGQVAAVLARTLRRRGFDGSVTILGEESHQPYQRPPLSKEFLTGDGAVEPLALLAPKWLENNEIDIRTGTRVDSVDAAGRMLTLADGSTMSSDAIVLATGGRPRRLPGVGSAERIHHLRTVDDAAALRDRLVPGARLAIIGGGFIGLEIASTATTLGVEVTVIEQAHTILERQLGARMAAYCTDLHSANGVHFHCGNGVSDVQAGTDGARVTLSDGQVVDADDVIVGIGMEPNTQLAADAGLAVTDGIVVNAVGRTAAPGVFAAGDVAARFSDTAGRHIRVEHFDNANRQAGAVARAILGEHVVEDGPHWLWSDQYDRNLQFVGNTATADEIVVRGDMSDHEFSAFYLTGGRLTGAFAVDRGEDIMAARELIGRAVDTPELTDEDIDLWELGEEMVS
ncbi:FAD-dependent oxidoreductase [Gordonia sp. PKS22-38]|uniref:FAD-dependent oxidoreductase n=1 Tax=Gordonia prachuapensis TaxID=3115651 RepID=A0ABU7MTC4_9ACTN|nr:FAD-dependent oxidoreductase [Gordonia sp. PKS22-38]